ncbi:hypothetical protein V2I01_26490 [Micromonospora sp. BRA006-A]|nr:hypothetical protein [Micromonospora sp. BRA006-A]
MRRAGRVRARHDRTELPVLRAPAGDRRRRPGGARARVRGTGVAASQAGGERRGAHVRLPGCCGARTESDALAQRCQFCAAPLVADAGAGELIAPEAVLPFAVDRNGVRTALGQWCRSRWFRAPGSLKKISEAETLKGTYLPHWTFDARTVSDYQGQRGEHYYVTETYTVTVDGKQETRTRQVRHTGGIRPSAPYAGTSTTCWCSPPPTCPPSSWTSWRRGR